jgi:hypothetical protein
MEATMSHTHIKVKAGSDPWRELPDNENTEKYIKRLSFAADVYALFDTGEAWHVDCGNVEASLFASRIIPASILDEAHR